MPEMPDFGLASSILMEMPDQSFRGKKMPDWHRRMPDGNSGVEGAEFCMYTRWKEKQKRVEELLQFI